MIAGIKTNLICRDIDGTGNPRVFGVGGEAVRSRCLHLTIHIAKTHPCGLGVGRKRSGKEHEEK